jgi:hypothetical protein
MSLIRNFLVFAILIFIYFFKLIKNLLILKELLCAENLEELLNKNKQLQINEEDEELAPPWRFGPGQIWYDRLGIPSNPSNFDYGMKKAKVLFKKFF